MTTDQRIMLFKLFRQAIAATGFTGRAAAIDQERERLTIKACGYAKSWTKFNNRDVDEMKRLLLAILRPADLNAQLTQIQMPRARLLYGLRQAALKITREAPSASSIQHPESGEAYIARIAFDKFATNDWASLPDADLSALHMTVCNRAKSRKAAAKSGSGLF